MVATPSLAPGETDLYKINSVIRWLLQGLGGSQAFTREVLTAARTYFVRTDGSDSNNGLVDSASGAFLTVQKAIDVVSGNLDRGIFGVTIAVRAGTFSAITLKAGLGTGIITISGAGSTTIIDGGTGFAVTANFTSNTLYNLLNFKTTGIGSIFGTGGGKIVFVGLEFASTNIQISIDAGFLCQGFNYSITASATTGHVNVQNGGLFYATPTTITITAGLSFGIFCNANNLGNAQFAGTSFTNGATVTGKRFFVGTNAVINTNTNSNPNFFPGNVAGDIVTGGQYL